MLIRLTGNSERKQVTPHEWMTPRRLKDERLFYNATGNLVISRQPSHISSIVLNYACLNLVNAVTMQFFNLETPGIVPITLPPPSIETL